MVANCGVELPFSYRTGGCAGADEISHVVSLRCWCRAYVL